MTGKNHREILLEHFHKAVELKESDRLNNYLSENITPDCKKYIDTVAEKSFNRKAVTTVLITLLVHKIKNPSQDVRYYQDKMTGGFSGRTIDTKFITPGLKSIIYKNKPRIFPYMVETGWLTRTLESGTPYALDYPHAITPKNLKEAFLHVIDFVEKNKVKPDAALICLFGMILPELDRKVSAMNVIIDKQISNAAPNINKIKEALESHFFYKYERFAHGAARLPVLALEAIYICIIKELESYSKCSLITNRHTGPDKHTAGDIDIANSDELIIESVEVKHAREIDMEIVEGVMDKLVNYSSINKYYILSTVGIRSAEQDEIAKHVDSFYKLKGIEIIINGVIDSIGYYLRLISDRASFLDNYVKLISEDEDIKAEHLEYWAKIQNTLLN